MAFGTIVLAEVLTKQQRGFLSTNGCPLVLLFETVLWLERQAPCLGSIRTCDFKSPLATDNQPGMAAGDPVTPALCAHEEEGRNRGRAGAPWLPASLRVQ